MNDQTVSLDLDEKRLPRTVLRLAWPVVLQEAAWTTLSMIIMVFIGHLGAEAIAAVLDGEFEDACVVLVDGSSEFIGINKDVGISTEQEPGTSITDQLHSMGIETDEYFIPSIRDVREITE